MHIELDYIKDQSYNGQGDIKLSNVFQDPSFIREPVSLHITKLHGLSEGKFCQCVHQ